MTNQKVDELRAAVAPLLHTLAANKQLPGEDHWVYERDGNGRVETKLSWMALIEQHAKEAAALEPKVVQWLSTYYPNHQGMVGTSMGFGQLQPHAVLWTIATEVYNRHKKFDIDADQLDSLLVEVDQFFREDSYHLNIFAVAYNIHGDANIPPTPFPGGFTLRPITAEELTRFYGGNPIFHLHQRPAVLPQFVFVKEINLPELFEPPAGIPAHDPTDAIFADLDRGMLALASFKEAGAVGYDGVRVETRGIAFGNVGGMMTYRSQEIPWSPYKLDAADVGPLTEHIKLFSQKMHSSLEIACQRLVDAGRRTKPRDAIMDAVIGMESILLNDLNDELSYRFRLNYSALHPTDRRGAFNLAKDLYKWRSKIAHGSSVGDAVMFNGQSKTLHEVAAIAKNTLRSAIWAFKDEPAKPAYLAEGYWEDLHLR